MSSLSILWIAGRKLNCLVRMQQIGNGFALTSTWISLLRLRRRAPPAVCWPLEPDHVQS